MPDQEQQPPANQPSQLPAHEPLALLARLSRFAKPKTLAELRELGMILVAIMYIIGYVTWSAYAYKIGLGPMPALDAQYFVAGGLILLLFCFAVAVAVGIRYEYWGRWPVIKKTFRATMLLFLIHFLLLLAILFVVAKAIDFLFDSDVWSTIFTILTLIIFYSWMAHRSFDDIKDEAKRVKEEDRHSAYYRFGPTVGFGLYTIAAIWLSVGMLMREVYPKMPQEIGGGKPRICRFDLASGAVSEQTRVLLTGDASTSAVLRTKLLPVIFAAGDSLYVRPETNWVAVKKEFVRAIDLNPVIEPVQPQPVDIEKMKNEVMHDMCTLPAFLWDMPLPQSTNTDESSGL